MKYVYLLVWVIAAGSCKKSDLDTVAKFVREVKAERYGTFQELPAFKTTHIDALLGHASDEQLVANYPRPPYSSYYGGPVEVGLVMLYAIEAIRQQKDWPFMGVSVFDMQEPERKVPLSEVLPIYRAWWAANKDKSADELRLAHPLKDTHLV